MREGSKALVRKALLPVLALAAANVAMASPAPAPEWSRQAVEVRCGGNILGLALEARRLEPAALVSVTVNGRAARLLEQAELGRFLGGVRGTGLQALSCRSARQLVVAVSGSRLRTQAGEEDDVTELFLLSFEEESS